MSSPQQPVVIYDPTRSFRMWHISEIYIPSNPSHPGRYVPNVNDLVVDYDRGFFRCTAADGTTLESTLVKWNPPDDSNNIDQYDILLGAGPGTQSESFRAYLDISVTPHILALDSRLHIYGTTSKYIKIYKGTDIGPSGDIISAYYDQSGSFLGDNIPLENVSMPDVNNIAIKAPKPGYTLRELPDGEVCTVVVFDDVGNVTSTAKVLIKNTAFMRQTDASIKYITGISVETPFKSASNPKLIQFPINMPVQNLNLMGVVHYSDGTKLRMPCDGTKFTMYGLDNFISSVQGQKIPLVLSYALSPNEYNYIGEPSPNKHISEAYEATTLKADGAYSVKLFAYPVWINELSGYRLEFFLYNLNRAAVYNVTNLVELATNSAPFSPTEYGVVQKLAYALDLNRVDAQFAAYRHVQTFEVVLLTQGTLNGQDNWTMGFDPGQDPRYGVGLEAIATFENVNNWKLNLASGCATKEEWLEKVFYASKPLYDPYSELKAPEPNFFVLVSKNHRVEVPIANWGSLLTVHEVPDEGDPVYLEFIRRTSETDLQLGKSGIVTHYAGT